jgi:hypothetical protein
MTMPTAETIAWEQQSTSAQQWPQCATQQLPENAELRAEIERAEQIMVGTNWEEEGQLYVKTTLDRAVAFLKMHSDFLKPYQLQLPVPHIGAGPGGSVDLHWKREKWELLVNIPASPDELASFYGDNYGAQKIKGSVDPGTFNFGIATWLMN